MSSGANAVREVDISKDRSHLSSTVSHLLVIIVLFHQSYGINLGTNVDIQDNFCVCSQVLVGIKLIHIFKSYYNEGNGCKISTITMLQQVERKEVSE